MLQGAQSACDQLCESRNYCYVISIRRSHVTFLSLCAVVCKAGLGRSQSHQPFLPLCCVDGSQVEILLPWDGQVHSRKV